MDMGLKALEDFRKKEPSLSKTKGLLAADDKTIEKQPCPNWRCRGNVDHHCVYHKGQYNICSDKGAVDSDFFKYD